MKHIVTLFILGSALNFSANSFAQSAPASDSIAMLGDTSRTNSIYIEEILLGLVYPTTYSINFDRLLAPDFAFRIGIASSSYPLNSLADVSIAVPVSIIYLPSVRSSSAGKGEIGAGIVFYDLGNGGVNGVLYQAIAGFRYERPQGGVVVRFDWTPILNEFSNNYIDLGFFGLLFFSLSLGYSF